MEGRADEPVYFGRPFADLAEYWRERWLLGRAEGPMDGGSGSGKNLCHY